jgi:predicted nucleic acid-binding protein
VAKTAREPDCGGAPCAIRVCRDPTDDKFLECAVSGGADYVVSADADLLSLQEVRGIPIVDVPAFWRKLSEHQDDP